MEYNISDVRAGFDAGLGQVSQEKMEPGYSLRENAETKLTKVLYDWPYDLNGRFVRDFAKAVMVAEASRETFDEPQLDEASIVEYLGHSVSFFNSWTHP